jgi:hypothetical protein
VRAASGLLSVAVAWGPREREGSRLRDLIVHLAPVTPLGRAHYRKLSGGVGRLLSWVKNLTGPGVVKASCVAGG